MKNHPSKSEYKRRTVGVKRSSLGCWSVIMEVINRSARNISAICAHLDATSVFPFTSE